MGISRNFRRMKDLLDRAVLSGLPEGSTVEVSPADADLQTPEQIRGAVTLLKKFRMRLQLIGNVPIGQITVRMPAR